jgi:hypothetical protein
MPCWMSWHWYSSENLSRVTLADEAAHSLRLYIMENCSSSSGSDVELGGPLLGWIEQYSPLQVRIQDFEAIACGHSGPYSLSDSGRKALEEAIARRRPVGLEVIGFFRSYSGREPILDPFDQEFFTTYFPNRSHVLLLLQPTSPADCRATFRFGDELSSKPSHSFFQFYEGMSQTEETKLVQKSVPLQDSVLVQDCQPESFQKIEKPPTPEPVPLSNFENQRISRNRLPWFTAVASVLLLIPAYIQFTGVRQTRSVAPAPKQAVTMTTPPVTTAEPTPEQPTPEASRVVPDNSDTGNAASLARPIVSVPPAIRHAVQPEIPSGIRARITDRILIPVRVRVSSAGKVVGVVLKGGGQMDGLHRYLRSAAAKAALGWTFEPAKTNEGIPIMAEREISFVFGRPGE